MSWWEFRGFGGILGGFCKGLWLFRYAFGEDPFPIILATFEQVAQGRTAEAQGVELIVANYVPHTSEEAAAAPFAYPVKPTITTALRAPCARRRKTNCWYAVFLKCCLTMLCASQINSLPSLYCSSSANNPIRRIRRNPSLSALLPPERTGTH